VLPVPPGAVCYALLRMQNLRSAPVIQRACSRPAVQLCSVFATLICLCAVLGNCVLAQEVARKDGSSSTSAAQTTASSAANDALRDGNVDRNSGATQTRLGPGDLVEISVYNIPELTTKARVSGSGELYLPLVDYVHVADLTQEEAQAIIEKRLSDGAFVNNPHVSVFIAENASGAVTLLGEVARPGAYPIIGDRLLYDIFSAAGGLAEKAGKTVTITHRGDPEHPLTVQLADNLAQTPAANVPIRQGDTIVVQRAGVVYVVGDVARPSGFLMDKDNLTVLRAIALAGGTTRTAKLSGAKLLRKTPEGVQQTTIALNKILQAKAPDIPMKADDVLFVPSSARKVAAYRGTEAIMQSATALSIIAIPRP
jgi:polysaccharide export outer membrane protein